ncbi:hypothetical protein ACQKWADRAFT_327938 [Trichoderma austrokoningii]
MPHLRDSAEWSLIQRIATEWRPKKASYGRKADDGHTSSINIDADMLEVELRQIFRPQEITREITPAEFKHCQVALRNLCSCLESHTMHRGTRGDIKGQQYPRLHEVLDILKSTPGTIDLVDGHNQGLFRLPDDDSERCDCLRIATECNETLSGLLASLPSESATGPPQIQRKEKAASKNSTLRDQVVRVLEILFDRFTCGKPHEVLLRIVENRNEDSMVSNLHLMLPLFQELKSWQQVLYDNADLDDDSVSLILSICEGFQQHTSQGGTLVLYIKENQVYGARADPVSSEVGTCSEESLDQLIKNGAFKSIDVGDFNIRPLSVRFSIMEKRKLAVKFGYCLMDFFNADFAPNKIHLFGSSKPGPMGIPYLAIGSKSSLRDNAYDFQFGHPTFLSFAKLLIEIELGGIIPLEIHQDSQKNIDVWKQLMVFMDNLQKERRDSYREAIANCLLFHMLNNSCESDSEDANSTIRRIIYEKIVFKLELGLAESSPRPISSRKRQRSESLSTSDARDIVQTAGSPNMAVRPIGSQRATPGNKRQRGPETSEQQSLANTNLPHSKYNEPLTNGNRKSRRIMNHSRPKSRRDFEIALICALQKESDAVEALFDESFEGNNSYGKARGDPNAYTVGRMAGHNVVLVFLSGMGKINSANAAAGVRMSFPKIKLGIVVGICGGVPGGRDGEKEVLLGDVIVSTALIQYDFGRQYDNKAVRRDTLQDNFSRPNAQIRSFLQKQSGIKGRQTLRDRALFYLDDLCARDGYEEFSYPGSDNDVLYDPSHRHKHYNLDVCEVCASCEGPYDDVCDGAPESSCEVLGCHGGVTISRARVEKAKGGITTDMELREAQKPFIHFGTIVSGDAVMKSGLRRDEIASREKAIAFEMEGAGVWDSFPTVVIKSACDYADSHKNKMWQGYAAATAAACTKAFLEEWRKAC